MPDLRKNDPSIQKIYTETGPIPRSEVLDKIPEKYSQFIKLLKSKLETRSYNASVVKCLLKGGYKRTSGSGRQIKWYLPEDIVTVPGKTAETVTEDVSNVVSESKEEVIMKTEKKLTDRKLIEQPNEEKNDVISQEFGSQEKVVVEIAKKEDDFVKPQEDTNNEEIEGMAKNIVVQEKPSEAFNDSVVQEKPSEAVNDSVVQEKPSEAAKDSVVQEKPSETVQEASTNEIAIDC